MAPLEGESSSHVHKTSYGFLTSKGKGITPKECGSGAGVVWVHENSNCSRV